MPLASGVFLWKLKPKKPPKNILKISFPDSLFGLDRFIGNSYDHIVYHNIFSIRVKIIDLTFTLNPNTFFKQNFISLKSPLQPYCGAFLPCKEEYLC